MFGTIDSWLLFKLTGEHVTDLSNASRTMLFDIAAGRWDPELLELLDVPERSLPRVLASAGVLGQTRPEALHGHAVPVAGVAGDQQAALFGQACVDPGMGKNTYGTGSFVLLNTGFTMPEPPPGLISTIAWSSASAGSRAYALEASIFVTGAAVQWLRDGLASSSAPRRPRRSPRRSRATTACTSCPALTGLGSPHWDPYARGTIVGLTRGAGRAHLRAGDARGDRLPDARRGPRDGGGVRPAAERAAGRRRSQREHLADAVPGRRARRSRRGSRDRRDDSARGGVPGGCGRRGGGR